MSKTTAEMLIVNDTPVMAAESEEQAQIDDSGDFVVTVALPEPVVNDAKPV